MRIFGSSVLLVVGTSLCAQAPTVTLVNRDWTSVNVEVRRGNEKDCAQNATFETKKLGRNDEWPVPAPDVDVCYRRDLDPDHPNGQWAGWHRVPHPAAGDIRQRIE